MTAPTCATCRSWHEMGVCKRMPPAYIGTETLLDTTTGRAFERPVFGWPTTDPGEWCGEHAPKQDAA